MSAVKIFLLLILLHLFCFINSAYAYLDPGTGSFLIQSIIATVFAVGMIVKMYWFKLSSIFLRRKSIEDEVSNPDLNNLDTK